MRSHAYAFAGEDLNQGAQVVKVAVRSMLCTTTVSPSRANRSSSVSSGLEVSLPEALSVKTRSKTCPSSWRRSFWSSVLTRTYPIRCPATSAS
jgi:hypothetical protein